MPFERADVRPNEAPLKVLLVEFDSEYAAHVVRELGRNTLAVTVARTLAEARAVLQREKSDLDVVVCALHLPDGRGESLLSDIQARAHQPVAIFTSEFLPDGDTDGPEYRLVALPKRVGPAALLRTVKTALGGEGQLELHRFVARFKLTPREAEATTLLIQGRRVKEIADCMKCSEQMIYAHLARVSRKSGCRDYHEVVCLLLALTCRAPRLPSDSPHAAPVRAQQSPRAPRR